MTPHERLRQSRKEAGYGSASSAADAFGWPKGTYLGHENGARGLRLESAKRYARAFRVDASWLLMGEPSPRSGSRGARPVDVVELAAAAGAGADAVSEAVTGCVWFRRDWLERRGLDPTRCAVIEVRGESMEPTLPNGCSILIDRARRDWRAGHVYVVRNEDGLIVKRAAESERGDRLMLSDHPAFELLPWPEGATILGEVRWVARTLP